MVKPDGPTPTEAEYDAEADRLMADYRQRAEDGTMPASERFLWRAYEMAVVLVQAEQSKVEQLRRALLWAMALDPGDRCPFCYPHDVAGDDALCPGHRAMKDTSP